MENMKYLVIFSLVFGGISYSYAQGAGGSSKARKAAAERARQLAAEQRLRDAGQASAENDATTESTTSNHGECERCGDDMPKNLSLTATTIPGRADRTLSNALGSESESAESSE